MEHEGSDKQDGEGPAPETDEAVQKGEQEGVPTNDAPEADAHGLEELEIGDGAQEPTGGGRWADFEKIEPGPTEVVSFASPRYGADAEADSEGGDAKREIPWARIIQIGVIVLVNLAVLGVAAYVVYRGLKREPPQEEQPLMPRPGADEDAQSAIHKPQPAPNQRLAILRAGCRSRDTNFSGQKARRIPNF